MVRFGGALRVLAQSLAPLAIVHQGGNGFDERIGVIRRAKYSAFTIAKDVGSGTYRRRYDRQSGSHGFDECETETLGQCREDEQVCLAVEFEQSGFRDA